MSNPSPNPAGLDQAGDMPLEQAVYDYGTVDRRIDIAVCVAVFLLGLAIFVLSGDIRQGSIHDPIGPDGWPKLLGAVLMATMGANILRRLASWRSEEGNLVVSDGDIRQGSIHDPIGPDGWPKLLGAVLMLTMGANIVRRLASWRSEEGNMVPSDGDKDDVPAQPSSFVRPFAMLAAGFVWVAVVPWIGFILATSGILIFGLALMRVRTPGKLLLIPFLLSLGTWLLFGVLFGIRLHAGPLEHALLDVLSGI